MKIDQPNLYCKNGHLIPDNGKVVDKKVLTTPRLVCEECARAEGGKVVTKRSPAKGHDLEKLGQESMIGTVPTIYIP